MIAPIYVAAREVLLDALDALGEQRQAVILAGAQAIYLHTGDAELAVAEYTTDGDLVVDPALLQAAPRLHAAMEAGGFRLDIHPGIWLRSRLIEGVLTDVPVDLLVPDAVAGAGRRGARLGEHGDKSGRRVRGLEGVLVDHSMFTIDAFGPDDPRRFEIRVAGPSALLVAKLHKIADRTAERRGNRLDDKDALDVLRLLRAVQTTTLATGLRRLLADEVAQAVAREAVDHLAQLFGATGAPGTQMAVQATERLEDPAAIAGSCVALTTRLVDEIRAGRDSPTRPSAN